MLDIYEQIARDLVTVYERDDDQALDRLGRHFNRIVSFDDVRAIVRRRLDEAPQGGNERGERALEIVAARDLIAQQAGFRNWAALVEPGSL